MTLERLQEIDSELVDQLIESKVAAVKRSAAVENSGQIVDAILLDVGSPLAGSLLARLDGYELAHVADWFEFVSGPYADDEGKCLELARNAVA